MLSLVTLDRLATILKVSIVDLPADAFATPTGQAICIFAWLVSLPTADSDYVLEHIQGLHERLRKKSGKPAPVNIPCRLSNLYERPILAFLARRSTMQYNRLPVVPRAVLKKHKVDEVTDSRFKASARLLQSLWREDNEFKIGSYRTPKGNRRKLGNLLHIECARQGANFLHPEIAKLVHRESVYREPGALFDEERLWSNLLSSQPLCFNLFGSLKLDAPIGNQFFQRLCPDFVQNVTGIYFEHSPGRRNPAFTDDHTAFDVFVTCTTPSGEKGFLAIEVKYSESMNEPTASLRPRYEELSAGCALFKDPAASALRESPLQQLWREHLLSQSMIANGLYNQGRFIVIYPEQNNNCDAAINAYRTHLIDDAPSATGFDAITLESCLANLRGIGNKELAEKLFRRYLDFGRVEEAIFG